MIERASADPGRTLVLVAVSDGRVVGFGKAGYFAPPPDVAPAGWQLTGVAVRPSHRRGGIATELISARLRWIEERDPVAWYAANERNLATIDLHAPFGFREVTRDFWIPGLRFSRGASGVLFRAEAPWRGRSE